MVFEAANAGFQTGLGAWQWYKGNQLEKQTVRPTYEIPEEAKKYLSLAEQQSLQGMPEAQRQAYIDNVMRNVSTGLYNLQSRSAGISGVSNVMAQSNDAIKNLAAQDAIMRQDNINRLQQARTNYANWQDKAFELNKLNPYYENINRAYAMQGAGMQNVKGGLQTAGEIESNERGKVEDMFKMMYGGKPTNTNQKTGASGNSQFNSGTPTGGQASDTVFADTSMFV